MIVVLGIDALGLDCAQKFGCKNLLQESSGKTDLSEYEEKRTVVIWSSIAAGRNTEKEVLSGGDMWAFRLQPQDTLFSSFRSPVALDLPGFTHDMEQHKKERDALKGYFAKTVTVEEYDAIAFSWHRRMKEAFFSALEGEHDIVFGYFDALDIVGHLSFGIEPKMRAIYAEFDDMAAKVRAMQKGPLLIVSDHGMVQLGSRFGDHSDAGFWSLNSGRELGEPKPSSFREFIAGELKRSDA
jgi:hypothetical protein